MNEITARVIDFSTNTEVIYLIHQHIADVSRVKIIGETVSVEYKHGMWRDEFYTSGQIANALNAG